MILNQDGFVSPYKWGQQREEGKRWVGERMLKGVSAPGADLKELLEWC